MSIVFRALAAAGLAAAACSKPSVSPGLDETCRPEDPTCQPGRISGNVVYSGKRRGDVILFLFKTSALPPPDGLGTSAAAVARIGADVMFGSDKTGVGPFAADFVFTQVPPDRYQIRGFINASGGFLPFFDFARQPRAGDPAGGHVSFDAQGVPHFDEIEVGARQSVSGISVGLGQELPLDPPAFTVPSAVDGAVTIPQTLDRPLLLKLKASAVGTDGKDGVPVFAASKFAVDLRLGANGLPAIPDGDGFFDAFPQMLLKQVDQVNADGSRTPVDALQAAIIPVKVNTLPVLPLLFSAPASAAAVLDEVEAAVLPIAGHLTQRPGQPVSFEPIGSIPVGSYQLVVIERTGQVWTLPNSLGARVPSQATRFEVATASVPSGRVRGAVRYTGTAKPGNIVVQVYKADPANPPPPVGTQLPIRVALIRASQVAVTAGGFSAQYTIEGLLPGKYVIEALSDGDGNFAPFNLLQTPTKGDLVGAVLDSLGHVRTLDVGTGALDGVDVTLVGAPGGDTQGGPGLDAPAFEFDEAKAQIAQDARGVVRFDVSAKPVAFPIGAGSSDTTRFTVALVRDAAGLTVDADGDGLPDVWPRAFLVQLDDSDPRGLTQKTPTTVLPAAVDPTSYLPRLLASDVPVLTSKVTIVVRPAALDATNPAALQRLPVMPAGRYKLVLMNQSGQVWQVPNDSGTTALAASARPFSPATASQSRAFQVKPAAGPAPSGSIAGTLTVTLPQGVSSFAGAYVFAFAADARNAPPPLGTGKPVSVDFHTAAEFTSGSVSYALRGLSNGDYFVTAIADTRGDFALEPQLFAAAPGEGALAGGHFASDNVHLEAVTVSGSAANVNVAVGQALPPRPSFELRQAGLPLDNDPGSVTPFFAANGLTPSRLTLHAAKVLGAAISPKPEASTPFFPVSLACQKSGSTFVSADTDFDNLPDLYPKVLIVKLSDADPSGLTVDPVTTAIPAAVDPAPFIGSLTTCASQVAAMDLSVIVAPVAVQPTPDGLLRQVPIPPGRYGVVLMSSTGQTWRIPNELQPSLLDASVAPATASTLAPQGQSIRVSSQVPAALGGGISGAVHITGYSPATTSGNLLLLAFDATALPPPLGLGKPLAVQVVPRTIVSALASTGGFDIPFRLSNLSARNYVVAALLDRGNQVSPLVSFAATPGFGSQISFFGGASPTPIPVSSSVFALAGAIALDVSTPSIPFDRPSFAVDAANSTPPTLSLSRVAPISATATVKLLPAVPSGLPYTPVGPFPGKFHPTVTLLPSGQPKMGTTTCDGTHFPFVSNQVFVTPIDNPAQTIVPVVGVDACQFCNSLTGNSNCATAPLTPPNGPLPFNGPLTFTVRNEGVDPAVGLTGVPPPAGRYAITVIEPTGLVWSLPNELALSGQLAQGAVFTVTP